MGAPFRSTVRSDWGRERNSLQLRARSSTRSAGPPSPRPTRPPADGDRQRRGPARCRQAVLRDLFGLDRLTEAHDLDPNPEAAVECLVKSIRWAQVNGLRGETDTPDKMRRRLEYDLYYIEH